MSRRKDAALPVPASEAEARELCEEYVAAERRVLELKLFYEMQIDRLKTERDQFIAGVAEPQPGRFAALKAWWEAGGRDMAGKRRSAELAGATIGIRTTPPAVVFARGWNGPKVLEWLIGLRLSGKARFVRTKRELDRQAIIKAIGEPEVAAAFNPVLSVAQVDEFFIDTGIDEEVERNRLIAATA